MQEGVFSSDLKLAKVVPIFKSGDSSKITNYRPISVLSFFSKVFERVMYNHITDFIDSLNVLYKYQFGFRHTHSTQQAIITLVNKITSSLDTGDLVIGTFIDLKKAFDTVDHTILLDKMHAYGIRGNILRWFRSYLTKRSQFVSYDGRQSKIQSITCGVPQGSILGPLLFIIYMNDICNVSELLFTVLYADDTCVVIHGKDMLWGNMLRWFPSYLTKRSQFVSYDGRQSKIQSITCGVPQGSILGPLLFIIYMNDICNVSELLFTVLYADDTCVVIHGKYMLSIITTLNHELHMLSTWLQANKLSLNTDKTYYMIFHRARIKLPDTDYPIIMNNSS